MIMAPLFSPNLRKKSMIKALQIKIVPFYDILWLGFRFIPNLLGHHQLMQLYKGKVGLL